MRQPCESVICLKKAGEYTIKKLLGQGRYGICYLAEDDQDRPVVLKYFRPSTRKKHGDFIQWEAVILSGLSHPSIPQFLGVVNNHRGYFFVLEYMKGDSLKTLLFQKRKEFSAEEIFQIGEQLLEILLYIHSRSVIHEDISISNVLYDGLQVSLIDLGLASNKGQEEFVKDLEYA